jgi:hypothetical protein
MANPVSKGIGTGAAQVYDYSRIDNAMNNAFQMISNKQERADKAKADKEAAKKKAEAKLRGEWKFDTTLIRDADIDVVTEMVNGGFNELNDHWEDIINGDPEWTNKFNSMSTNIKNYIANSKKSKEQKDMLLKEWGDGSLTGHSKDQINRFIETDTIPGYFISDMQKDGFYNRDQVVGNPFTKVDKVFLDNTDSLYETVDKTYKTAQGVFTSTKRKTWKDDSEAFPKFMTTVENTPELMNDIRILYGNPGEDVTEDQIRQFYNDYKESRINEWEKTAGGAAPEKEEKEKVDSFASRGLATPVPFKESKGSGLSISSLKGSDVPTLRFVRAASNVKGKIRPEQDVAIKPSSIWKDKNGVWRIKGIAYTSAFAEIGKKWEDLSQDLKDKYKSEKDYMAVSAKGDQIQEEIKPSTWAAIEARYGFTKDYAEKQINSLEGGQEETEDKTITRSDLTSQAKKSGYSEDEYRKLLEENGYTITK